MESVFVWGLIAFGVAHIVYTYGLYPLMTGLLPERPLPPRTLPAARLVSIVIAARKPGRAIGSKARAVLERAETSCELVIGLDGPDEEAESALAEIDDPRLVLVRNPLGGGKAETLNCAVAAAKGDVLVFMDLRQEVAAGAVERLVEALRSPDLGAISGWLEIAPAAGGANLLRHYWRHERKLRLREAGWDSAVGVTGALYAMKRSLWTELPRGLLLDDLWVAMQVIGAGQRVGIDPQAVARDVSVGADPREMSRKVRTLAGNYQLAAWMPWVLNPFNNRVWWQYVSHKLLRLVTPLSSLSIAVGAILIAGGAAIWAAVVLAALAAISPRLPSSLPGRALLTALRTGMMLQIALLLAFHNALHARWDLWGESAAPTPGQGVR